jgi:hypothetical protein
MTPKGPCRRGEGNPGDDGNNYGWNVGPWAVNCKTVIGITLVTCEIMNFLIVRSL